MVILLPAAGFGKRTPQAKVKELMLHNNKPLIEFSYDLLQKTEDVNKDIIKKICVITRPEKQTALSQWLKQSLSRQHLVHKTEIVIHSPLLNDEWPKTLSAARSSWDGECLVLLPDTLIKHNLMLHQKTLVELASEKLKSHRSFWGVVQKPLQATKTFGVIKRVGETALSVTEKPQKDISPWVWGCFGFQADYGKRLLEDLELSTHTHEEIQLAQPSFTIELEGFEDLSRGGHSI